MQKRMRLQLGTASIVSLATYFDFWKKKCYYNSINSFLMLFCRLLIFFKIIFFEKNLSGIPSECQRDWIQIRPEICLA